MTLLAECVKPTVVLEGSVGSDALCGLSESDRGWAGERRPAGGQLPQLNTPTPTGALHLGRHVHTCTLTTATRHELPQAQAQSNLSSVLVCLYGDGHGSTQC